MYPCLHTMYQDHLHCSSGQPNHCYIKYRGFSIIRFINLLTLLAICLWSMLCWFTGWFSVFHTDPSGERFPDVRRPSSLCWHRFPPSPLFSSSLPSLTIQLTPSAHMAALPFYHPPPLCLSTVGVSPPSLQCCNIAHPAPSPEITAVIKNVKNATKLVDPCWLASLRAGLTMMTREESK